jgi:hypothetical protein
MRSQPVLGNNANDNAANRGGCAELLAPLVAAGYVAVVDEYISYTIRMQPSFNCIGDGIISVGMADKYN